MNELRVKNEKVIKGRGGRTFSSRRRTNGRKKTKEKEMRES
jgi:hypothetical protein